MATNFVNVEIRAGTFLRVTVTTSLRAARDWVNRTLHFHRRHADELQVGVGFYGDPVCVIAVSTGLHCLLVQLDLDMDGVFGTFANFLNDPSHRLLGFNPEPVLPLSLDIPRYYVVNNPDFQQFLPLLHPGLIRDDYVHDQAQTASDWLQWPLTLAQVTFASVEVYACYVVLLQDHLGDNN